MERLTTGHSDCNIHSPKLDLYIHYYNYWIHPQGSGTIVRQAVKRLLDPGDEGRLLNLSPHELTAGLLATSKMPAQNQDNLHANRERERSHRAPLLAEKLLEIERR